MPSGFRLGTVEKVQCELLGIDLHRKHFFLFVFFAFFAANILNISATKSAKDAKELKGGMVCHLTAFGFLSHAELRRRGGFVFFLPPRLRFSA